MSRNKFFNQRSVLIKKFFLVYLRKIKENKIKKYTDSNICIDFFKKKCNKIKPCKEQKINEHLRKNFLEFILILKNMLNSFSRNTQSSKNLNKRSLENFSYGKNNTYSIRNYWEAKERNFFWFYDQKKNQINQKLQEYGKFNDLFNVKNLFRMVSRELRKKDIIGFSKKSSICILEFLKKTVENIIFKTGTIASKRQHIRQKIFQEWGINNIIRKKNSKYAYSESNVEFMRKLKKAIRKYKVNTKTKSNPFKKIGNIETIREKDSNIKELVNKNAETEEILNRANKTLMTLLKEILQSRVEELRKATLCLEAYVPSEIKYIFEKKEPNKENLMMPLKQKTKKNQNDSNVSIDFLKSRFYLSGIDCFLFLKENENYDHKNLSMALLIVLMSDFNLKFQRKLNKIPNVFSNSKINKKVY